jgi:transposase
MKLPATGTAALLELLSPFVPDDHINELVPRHRGRGRRSEWSAAQLLRVLLLLLLSPVRSSNQLCRLLPEQRAWRRFAHLPNRRLLPNVRQLHEFRDRLTPRVLRALNEALVALLLEGWPCEQPGIGLIDSTDLPAATSGFKKSSPATIRPSVRRSGRARSRPARAAGLPATKSTRCGCGCRGTSPPCC